MCGRLYSVLLSFFVEHYENPESIVAMFHAYTPDSCKEKVLQSLRIDNSIMRIIICTSALECGVNVKNVRYVIHYGPSYDVVDYCQQIGRAGRNTNDQCYAVMYLYSNAKRNITQKLKTYISCKSCLRTELYTQFNENGDIIPPLEPKHNCCTICSVNCDCGDCPIRAYEVPEIRKVKQFSQIRNVSDEQREFVNDLILGYKESMSTGLCVPPSITTGLTDEKIDKIVANLENIDSSLFLVQRIGLVENKTIKKILQIINIVFNDIDIDVEDLSIENMVMDTNYFSDNDSLASLLCTDSSDDE
ncbi:uncharacterized protein [Clytia hemisphaerica]|uniref:uncharacterized protein n=1 Tax=Clytia hemisphaerica TaxID=252671 RepID=UPI0034D5E418